MTTPAPRTWFVTGASSGFGDAIVAEALARGERVVATARRPRQIRDHGASDDRLVRLPLDVTDQSQVDDAVRAAVAAFGGIDVLVNNAGHGMLGALEELTTAELSELIDVNVLGVHRVTRAALGHLRTRGGHVVALSSVGGVIGNAGHAAYATTKFALEGMSEALAGEVAPFGVRVTIVEPGPFRTDFHGRSMRASAPLDAYRDTPAGRLRERMPAQMGRQAGDPRRAAAAIVDVTRHPDPPLRLPLGAQACTRIGEALRRRVSELDAWDATGRATDFPDAAAPT